MTGEQIPGFDRAFVGTHTHSLDPKKRLTIPSNWRDQVGDEASLYVLPDFQAQKCLYVLPASEMSIKLEKIRQHAISDPRASQFARVLASRSDLVNWDSQGRIRISDELLAEAGLQDQVVMVGAFTKFELWNPEKWRQYTESTEYDMGDAARYLEF